MHILFLNPFHGGSHAAVAEGYARSSRHTIDLLTLPIAGGWRWRMRGAAVTLARLLRERFVAADHRPPTTDHPQPEQRTKNKEQRAADDLPRTTHHDSPAHPLTRSPYDLSWPPICSTWRPSWG